MRRIFKTMGAMLMLGAGLLTAQAAPADGRARAWEQPDGSSVTLSLLGDEAFHCFMTPEGYVAELHADGYYYFVGNDGRITSYRVSDGVPAQVDKNLSFEAYRNANYNQAFAAAKAANQSTRSAMRIDKLGNSKYDNTDGHDLREVPTEGKLRVLVLLVNFADKTFSVDKDPLQLMTDMLNKEGFDRFDASGSVYDYFRDISFDKFHPQFDVFGPFDLSKNSADYVQSDETYTDSSGKEVAVYPAGRMIEEACRLADDQVNFADYDANNDGVVDFVYVFHAGKGATTGGSQKTDIWPHAFTLTSAIGAPIELDGVKVNRYATSCEVGRESMQLAGAGMFVHEFSHVLGLPDLYDTANNGTQSKVFSPGTFSNLDSGNYNNDLHTPPMYSTYEQYALEWMKPVTITGSGDFTLLPLTARPFGYKVDTPRNPMEYFLLEARAPYSWDEYLEGHGMLIWHIDYMPMYWENNTVNNVANHQRIDIVEADNNLTAASRSGDTFPGSEGVHEIYANSTPALAAWDHSPLAVELSNIQSHPDGTVTFLAEGSSDMKGIELAAVAPNVYDVTAEGASLYWSPVEGADGYMVSVFDMDSFDSDYYRDYAAGWYFRDVQKTNKVEVDGLKAGKNYGVMVYAYNELAASRMAHPVCFNTHSGEFAASAPNIAAYSGADGAVQLVWDQVADASHYQLTVATRQAGEVADSDKATFDGSACPAGWSTNGRYDTRDRYCGAAVPSVNLVKSGDYLKTNVYERDIKSISFHNMMNYSEEAAAIQVYGIDAEGHTRHITDLTELSNKQGTRHTLDIPAGYKQLMLRWDAEVSGLTTFIDDVEVSLCDGPKDTPVSGYAARKVEDTKLDVTGLDANTSYVAYVQPVKGEELGKMSKAVEFVPSKVVLGIETLPAEDYVEADVLIAGGAVSANGQVLTLYSIDGKVLGQGVSVELPSRGLYIVKVGNATKKICY